MAAECEHGVTAPQSEGVAMNAPWALCGCCRFTFYYLDGGSYTTAGSSSRTWTPKDRCGPCGGGYVDRTDRRPQSTPSPQDQGAGK